MTKIREGYKETEIGVIPEDWEAIELSNISDLITKGTTPTTYGFEFVDEGVNFIKIESINDTYGTLIPSSFSKITNECHQKLNRSILKSGDILFAIAGATVGKCAMIKNEELPANTNQALAIIRLKENENKQFVFHQLRGYYIQQKISQIKTNTAQPNLNLKQIGDFKFAYPKSTCEQQRIAEILSTTDSHIEKLDKTIEDYQLLKKGMMKELLTEGIGHTEFKETEIGRIPKEWEVRKISNICTIGRGRVISKKEIEDKSGEYPVYSSQTTNDGCMGNINTYDFEGEYVTWTTDGVNAGSTFYRNGKFNCTNVCGTLKLKDTISISHKFLSLILNNFTDKYVVRNGNPKLMNNIMGLIEIPIPNTIEEQSKISETLFAFDEYLKLLESEKTEYVLLRKSLMEKLLTGKIRITSSQLEA